ncbi:zinc finger C2H2-type domain protein (plasmid) [Methanohalobium evestigatum Z-7303]|uniref:Zinc finger C2H2-type domain protein n=1 Tax=Methanohalobium evestigatum (strain ATCC BAA-1072 / DSM 3721 / NBRC 107634 / OCM 161 / Z-7303) TaxID=644295 RepID=D7EC48_METEZ|nr:zinc finger C2H2-type domain-containing protein [Methanohalobium evestigatum]ADI75170.1 zinc finger C2H2-type domain protein [Methanohalobium evestigatum Z-7303]
MSVCKNCGKKPNHFGFCQQCGTRSYVVSDEKYQSFIKNRPSHPSKVVTHEIVNSSVPSEVGKRKKTTSGGKNKKHNHICGICSSEFDGKNKLINHMEKKHGLEFTCEYCSRKFISEHALNQHKNDVHHTSKESLISTFDSKNKLIHMEKKHSLEFTCEYCSRKFISEHVLNQHKNDVHHAFKESLITSKESLISNIDENQMAL